jgi:regulator of protease activity HflC (stomatin/prohibitin superfamily)
MTMPVPSVRLGSRTLLLGASIIAIAALANGSWFRVRQNEVAYVTRFGQVVDAQAGPLRPGLHFKLPLQDRERARVEAETVVVTAKGEADSQYTRAEGQARAQLAQARAEVEATKLRGEADATAIRAKIEAAGGVDGYTRQLQAQASLNWKGSVPQIMGTSSGQFPLILPLQLDEKAK